MTLAGSWGQPRNRYTRTVQPGQTGGMNAQGSVRQAAQPNFNGAQMRSARSPQIKYGDPSVFNRYPNSPDPSVFPGSRGTVAAQPGSDPSDYKGNKTPSFNAGAEGTAKTGGLKFPSYVDARYQSNVADLIASLEQQKAQTVLDLSNMRANLRSGKEQATEGRIAGYDQLYGQLGSGNAGRSGYARTGQEQVQTDYQRGLDDLLRQFGPGQQKLTKDLVAIANKQFMNKFAAEGQGALDRKAAYEMAGQAPPSFTPSETFTLPGAKKPNKPKTTKGSGKGNGKSGVNKL